MKIVLDENIAQAISENRSGDENRWIIIQKTSQRSSLRSHAFDLFPDFNWVAVTVDAEPTVFTRGQLRNQRPSRREHSMPPPWQPADTLPIESSPISTPTQRFANSTDNQLWLLK
jgi:hypothetical protein